MVPNHQHLRTTSSRMQEFAHKCDISQNEETANGSLFLSSSFHLSNCVVKITVVQVLKEQSHEHGLAGFRY